MLVLSLMHMCCEAEQTLQGYLEHIFIVLLLVLLVPSHTVCDSI